jgi:hypothetical protein
MSSGLGSALEIGIGILWIIASLACLRGLNGIDSSTSTRTIRGLSFLGFIVTFIAGFAIATTILIPLVIALLPALLVFLVLIFRPAFLQKRRGLRIYLQICVGLSALTYSVLWFLTFVPR